MPSQGAIINIAGSTPVDDPEYRYKMPSVFGKIEGRGNGIKTVIPNISEVALALHREPGEVNKFFGTELGAQTTYNADTDRAVVNGAHTDQVLQEAIKKYIDVFVLCPQCGLPETDYKIKSGCIYHKCMACGNKEMVDMNHKLCTYILAQDKKAKTEKKKGGKKDKSKGGGEDGEKDKKKKKKSKGDDGSDEGEKKKKSKSELVGWLMLIEVACRMRIMILRVLFGVAFASVSWRGVYIFFYLQFSHQYHIYHRPCTIIHRGQEGQEEEVQEGQEG